MITLNKYVSVSRLELKYRNLVLKFVIFGHLSSVTMVTNVRVFYGMHYNAAIFLLS